jgi:hypothetical protein
MSGRFSVAWVAAVSALVAGIGGAVLGFVLSRSQEQPAKMVVAPTPSPSLLSGASSNALLLTTLESGESGKTATDGDRSVHVILTFESEDGHYCRAFGSRDAGAAAEGVACRSDAQWQVVAWDGTADPSEGSRSSELLDDVMDRLGGGAALEAAEERALIERHWSPMQ